MKKIQKGTLAVVLATGFVGLAAFAVTASEQEKDMPIERSGMLERNWQSENQSLSFADGQYSGNTGCNNFSGTYVMLSENEVEIQPMVLTKKMCFDEAVMKKEAHFAEYFPGTYTIRDEGPDTLVLINDEQSWIFGANDG